MQKKPKRIGVVSLHPISLMLAYAFFDVIRTGIQTSRFIAEGTSGADCAGWMKEAGFSRTRVEPLVGPDSMVIGIK